MNSTGTAGPPPPIDIGGDYWNDDDDPENDPAYNKNYILPKWSKCGKWVKEDFCYVCNIVQRIPGAFVYAN